MMRWTAREQVYRAARAEGWAPPAIVYLLRPPVVDIDWDGDGSDSGTFAVDGKKYTVKREYTDDCLCREDDEMAGDLFDSIEHFDVIVSRGGESAALGSVCAMLNTPTQVLADERYLAEVAVDIAREVDYLLARSARTARAWAADRSHGRAGRSR